MATAKKEKPKVLNLTVGFNHDGKHYHGMAIHSGVDFSLVEAPCGASRQIISLANAGEEGVDWPAGVFWDTTSCVNDKSDKAVTGYLKVKPV